MGHSHSSNIDSTTNLHTTGKRNSACGNINPMHEYYRSVLISKLKKAQNHIPWKENDPQLLEFIDCMVDEEKLKQTYLNPDWTITQLILKEYQRGLESAFQNSPRTKKIIEQKIVGGQNKEKQIEEDQEDEDSEDNEIQEQEELTTFITQVQSIDMANFPSVQKMLNEEEDEQNTSLKKRSISLGDNFRPTEAHKRFLPSPSKPSRVAYFHSRHNFSEIIKGSQSSSHNSVEVDIASTICTSKQVEEAMEKLTPQDWEVIHNDIDAQLTNKIKLKLIITEIYQEQHSKRQFRRLLAPIISNLFPEDKNLKFGLFHTALIIGEFKLEWNNSSIVVPKKVISQAALLTTDIDYIATIKEFKDAINKLAKVIVKWNTSMYYANQNALGKNNLGNCQAFTNECLEALGIDLDKIIPKNSPLGQYLLNMKRKGYCKLKFHVTQDFFSKFTLQSLEFQNQFQSLISFYKKEQLSSSIDTQQSSVVIGKMKFTTHKQLDEFIHYLLKIDPSFQENYKWEYMLLKSFDRAFWIRHFRNRNDETLKPLMGTYDQSVKLDSPFMMEKAAQTSVSGCPFDNPVYSGSILFNHHNI